MLNLVERKESLDLVFELTIVSLHDPQDHLSQEEIVDEDGADPSPEAKYNVVCKRGIRTLGFTKKLPREVTTVMKSKQSHIYYFQEINSFTTSLSRFPKGHSFEEKNIEFFLYQHQGKKREIGSVQLNLADFVNASEDEEHQIFISVVEECFVAINIILTAHVKDDPKIPHRPTTIRPAPPPVGEPVQEDQDTEEDLIAQQQYQQSLLEKLEKERAEKAKSKRKAAKEAKERMERRREVRKVFLETIPVMTACLERVEERVCGMDYLEALISKLPEVIEAEVKSTRDRTDSELGILANGAAECLEKTTLADERLMQANGSIEHSMELLDGAAKGSEYANLRVTDTHMKTADLQRRVELLQGSVTSVKNLFANTATVDQIKALGSHSDEARADIENLQGQVDHLSKELQISEQEWQREREFIQEEVHKSVGSALQSVQEKRHAFSSLLKDTQKESRKVVEEVAGLKKLHSKVVSEKESKLKQILVQKLEQQNQDKASAFQKEAQIREEALQKETRLKALELELSRMRGQLSETQQKQESMGSTASEKKMELEALRKDREILEFTLAESRKKLEEVSESAAKYREATEKLESSRREMTLKLKDLDAKSAQLAQENEKLQDKIRLLQQDSSKPQSMILALQERLSLEQKRAADLDAERREQQERLQSAEKRIVEMSVRVEELNKEKEALVLEKTTSLTKPLELPQPIAHSHSPIDEKPKPKPKLPTPSPPPLEQTPISAAPAAVVVETPKIPEKEIIHSRGDHSESPKTPAAPMKSLEPIKRKEGLPAIGGGDRVSPRPTALPSVEEPQKPKRVSLSSQHRARSSPSPPPLPSAAGPSVVPPLPPPHHPAPAEETPTRDSPKKVWKVSVKETGENVTRTIKEAVEKAQAGDTITVMPGTYEETFVINKSVNITSDNTRPSQKAILHCGPLHIQGGNPQISGIALERGGDGSMGPCVVISGHSEPFFANCVFTSYGAECVVVEGEHSNPQFLKCKMNSGNIGVLFKDGAKGLVKECSILNQKQFGVSAVNGSSPDIVECRIAKCGDSGVHFSSNSRGEVTKCQFGPNSRQGVSVSGGANPHVVENTFEGEKRAVNVFAQGLGVFERNVLKECATGFSVDATSKPEVRE